MKDISSYSELQDLTEEDTVRVTDDIYLTASFEPIENFNGEFNGNGYTIYNLTTKFIENMGEDSILKNITFSEVRIKEDVVAETSSVIGKCEGMLRNVTVTGQIDSTSHASGLVGTLKRGRIQNCAFYGQIKSKAFCSGLVVEVSEGNILNSEVKGSLFSHERSSGISNEMYNSTVENTQVYATLFGGECSGGLYLIDNSVVKNCSYNGTMFGELVVGFIDSIEESDVSDCDFKAHIEADNAVGFTLKNINSNITNINCKVTFELNHNTSEDEMSIGSYGFMFSNEGVVQNVSLSVTANKDIGTFCKKSEDGELTNISTNIEADILESNYTEAKKNNSVDYTIIEESTETIEVSSEEDLQDIKHNSSVILKDDILVSDSFETLDLFSGELDGNGYTISSLNEPFINVAKNPIIKNVKFSNCDIRGDFTKMGVVCRKGIGEFTNITIENCSIVSSGSVVGRNYGGIIGEFLGGRIRECKFKGKIDAARSIGGIAGRMTNMEKVEIASCTSEGKISGNRDVSGLIGNGIRIKVKNCINYSSVSGDKNCAGILGCNIGKNTEILNCKNFGSIEGNGAIGGITGRSECLIKNSVNSGKIVGDKSSVGGVTGQTSKRELKFCSNTGDIFGKLKTGGIAGVSSSNITKCINKGSVSGTSVVGGVVGLNSGDITSVVSDSNVSGDNRVGGLCGVSDPVELNMIYIKGELSAEEKSHAVLNLSESNISYDNVLYDIKDKSESSIGTKKDLSDQSVEEIKQIIFI